MIPRLERDPDAGRVAPNLRDNQRINRSNSVDVPLRRSALLLSMISLESQAFNCIEQLDEVAFPFVFDAQRPKVIFKLGYAIQATH